MTRKSVSAATTKKIPARTLLRGLVIPLPSTVDVQFSNCSSAPRKRDLSCPGPCCCGRDRLQADPGRTGLGESAQASTPENEGRLYALLDQLSSRKGPARGER